MSSCSYNSSFYSSSSEETYSGRLINVNGGTKSGLLLGSTFKRLNGS